MRITVEIDENDLEAVKRYTGINKTSPAMAEAVHGFLRQKEKEVFLKSVLDGETDFAISNEEIEESASWEN